jgi:hypothetical protein
MATQIESRRFEAQDGSGNSYIIVAERDVVLALGIYERTGPWRFRLEDGHVVSRNEQDGSYFFGPEAIRLTASDPNEPKD